MPTYSWEKSMKKKGSGLYLSLFIVAFVVFGIGRFAYSAWFAAPTKGTPEVNITVVEGERFFAVANDLEDRGVVSAFWLRAYVKFFDDATVYPGDYVFIPGSSYASIMAVLHQVESHVERITIPEGYSLADIGVRVHKYLPSITIEEWNSAVGVGGTASAHPFVAASMKPSDVDLEGYLFPDTYEFSRDATADDIANIMIDTMKSRIDDLGAPTGDAAGFSTHDMLTLASIVEKEVRKPETMNNVADIFLKRIAINMALQSDATINYIIDGDNPSPLYSDLEVDSPYNTYKNPGLPPGPISAPGLNALTAVFHPTHNDYYYFLTTDEGDIYYAKTYNQHLVNKANHLK